MSHNEGMKIFENPRKMLVDQLIQLASCLKEEDLQDPETFALAVQLVQLLDPKPEPLPQDLIDKLSSINDRQERFKQAALMTGARDDEAFRKLKDSMRHSGLLKSDE